MDLLVLRVRLPPVPLVPRLDESYSGEGVSVVPIVLNLGSGSAPLPPGKWDDWEELRVDADERTGPDVVGDLRKIPLPDAYGDAAYLGAVLEHFAEEDVRLVLLECFRVLRPEAELVVIVPDLTEVAREILAGRLLDSVSETAAGPIRPLDMLYGNSEWSDNAFMYHRTGFTGETLGDALAAAGFSGRVLHDDVAPFSLIGLGRR